MHRYEIIDYTGSGDLWSRPKLGCVSRICAGKLVAATVIGRSLREQGDHGF